MTKSKTRTAGSTDKVVPEQLERELVAGRRIVALLNAQLVCPTPYKHSYRTVETAATEAARLTTKTGIPWESVRCYCRRFHVRHTPPP